VEDWRIREYLERLIEAVMVNPLLTFRMPREFICARFTGLQSRFTSSATFEVAP
jgi:hypothetical protein